MSKRDWSGCTITIPEQHNLIITGRWKKDKPDMWWWWKCNSCKESSGVMSTNELEKLEAKGMISERNNDTKMPAEYSGHPSERELSLADCYMYGCGF